jgi:hypothetical protein
VELKVKRVQWVQRESCATQLESPREERSLEEGDHGSTNRESKENQTPFPGPHQ